MYKFRKLLIATGCLLFLSMSVLSLHGKEFRLTHDDSTSVATSIAMGKGDNLHLVWSDDRTGNWGVFYKQWNGTRWNSFTELVPGMMNAHVLPFVSSVGDTVHVVWTDDRDGNWEIYYKRSIDGGISWEADVRLTYDGARSIWGVVKAEGNKVHIVWGDDRDGDIEIFYKNSLDGGTSWESSVSITSDSVDSWLPSMAVSGDKVYIAWYNVNLNGTREIYFTSSTDAGASWRSPVKLVPSKSFAALPSISAQGSYVHLVWQDYRNQNYDIYYMNSADGGLTWSQEQRLTFNERDELYPEVICIGERVSIVWQEGGIGKTNLYLIESRNNGHHWDTPVEIVTGTKTSHFPLIAANPWNTYIAWSDNRDGNWEVYFKGYTVENIIQEVDNISALAENNARRLVQDGDGNLHLVYSSGDSVWHIKSSDGGGSWQAPVSIGGGLSPAVISDGNILHCVWEGVTNSSASLLYSRYDNGWSSPQALFTTPGAYHNYLGVGSPSLTINNDTCFVVWESVCGGLSGIHSPDSIFLWVIRQPGLSLLYGSFPKHAPGEFEWRELDFIGDWEAIREADTVVMQEPDRLVRVIRGSDTVSVMAKAVQKRLMSPALVFGNNLSILWQGAGTDLRLYTRALDWSMEILTKAKSISDPYISISGNLIHLVWVENQVVYHMARYTDGTQVTPPTAVAPGQSPFISGNFLVFEKNGEIYQSEWVDFGWTTPPRNISNTEFSVSQSPQLLYSTRTPVGGPTPLHAHLYKIWVEGWSPYFGIRWGSEPVSIQAKIMVKGGTPEPSPWTVKRDTFVIYGAASYQSVDMALPASPAELIYRIPSLDATKRQELVIVCYQESDEPWELEIELADILDVEIELPAYERFEFRTMLDLSELEDEVYAEVEEGELTIEQQTIFDNLVQTLVTTRTTAEIEIEVEIDEGEMEIDTDTVGDFTDGQLTLIGNLIASLETGIIGDKVKLKIETEFEELLLKIIGEDNPAVLSWFMIYEYPDEAGGDGGAQTAEESLIFALHQNYPNPFRGKTTIGFSVAKLHPTPCTLYPVSLKIYDVAGRVVRTLVDERLKAGHYSVKFDSRNLASGVYFARLTAGQFKETRKMILLR